ncbi:hypothetical protein GQ53DRAFT_880134 [Thozetella sp. PMI_491]|nr:hypothetical protein GQ53DRAFT_880134 [Thozetella sp. PMI_491]
MKGSLFITIAAAVGTAAAANFTKVTLEEPLNWIAGRRLFPGNIIAGYHDDLDNYTASAWATYVLDQCKGYTACTSAEAFQATNSGSTGGRYWFGYVYRGGPTTIADYVRDEGVTDSVAYTIVLDA